MKKIMVCFLVCFLCAESRVVLTIDDHEFSFHEFFSRYQKKQWERADSLQKDRMFTEFLMRELCVLESEKLGFLHDPDVAVKIRNHSQQLLVNESYEQFVARPLISSSDLEVARKHAKRELFASHILIGHSGAYLGSPPLRTLDEALILSLQIKKRFDGGEGFRVLAEKYSDDPGVEKNSGSLGWVPWGATVQDFQVVAFSLGVGVMSEPVLTDFGYHLILINDVRPSENQYLNDEAYENLVINLTKNSIRDQLRPAALRYDSLKIDGFGVYFNMNAIQIITRTSLRAQKENSLSGVNSVDPIMLLGSLSGLDVVCVYGGKGYGPKWFAQRLKLIPSSRRPALRSEEDVLSVFRTIILQDIALNDGLSGGVRSSFTYKQRRKEMVSGLLYDAYLKHLVVSAPKPDSIDVIDYYNENKVLKYMTPEEILVREIRVSNRNVADSLLLLLDVGADFSLLAQQNSSVNPGGGGLFGPFSKKQNRPFFDAASLLEIGGISPVISSSGNNFSIIMLVEKKAAPALEIDRVYVQIESLLIRKMQDSAKTEGIDGLLMKYDINKNFSLLN